MSDVGLGNQAVDLVCVCGELGWCYWCGRRGVRNCKKTERKLSLPVVASKERGVSRGECVREQARHRNNFQVQEAQLKRECLRRKKMKTPSWAEYEDSVGTFQQHLSLHPLVATLAPFLHRILSFVIGVRLNAQNGSHIRHVNE